MVSTQGEVVSVGALDYIFGAGRGGASMQLPTGDTVADWIRDVEAERGAGYGVECHNLMLHYRGQGKEDTRQSLKLTFPESWQRMQVVTLPVVRKLAHERAQVFGGDDETLEWVDGDGEPDEAFAEATAGAGLWGILRSVDRRVEMLRRCFVRVTWDAEREGVRLTVFEPQATYPRFGVDSRDLDRAHGVLFELEPIVEKGERIRRWELWTPEHVVIVDEKGRVDQGETEGENPYRYDDGAPCVPVVSFAAEPDDAAGYWQAPRSDWLDTQRAINADETNMQHLARVAGYGVWVSESSSSTAAPWPAKTQVGPDVIVEVPEGRSFDNRFAQADFKALGEVGEQHIKRVTALNDLPAGSVLSDSRAVPSGVALSIERLPLMETRRDRLDVYDAPMRRLAEVIRVVWNHHAREQIGQGEPRWRPGDQSMPTDPAERARLDEVRVRLGVSNPVRLLMRDEGLSREDARALLAEMKEDLLPPARPGDASAAAGNAGGALAGAAFGGGERVSFFMYELEGGVVTINEVRASKGLPPIADGDLTLPQLRARYPEVYATSAVTQASGSAEKIVGLADVERVAPAGAGASPFAVPPPSPLRGTSLDPEG